jgi:molybdopterin-binding protein
MAENEFVRIEVGLDGGQILSVLVTAASADDLERAVGESATSALSLQAQDGVILLVIPRVLYMKRFAREGRVGFGH